MPTPEQAALLHDPYAAFRGRDYRAFAVGFVSAATGLQMLATAISWEVYERTGDPLALGLAGLARALPVLLIALPAGQAADLFSRKRLLTVSQSGFAVVAVALAAASGFGAPVWTIYLALVASGVARAFHGPARSALLPQIVPVASFNNAVAWNSSLFQFAAMVGPLLAGALIALCGAAWPVYAVAALGNVVFAVAASRLRPHEEVRPRIERADLVRRFSLRSMTEGAGHLRAERTILGALALDLFAVLLGGATALMPVFARDILHAGPVGLGALRAAPFVGAFLMALALAHRPPFRRAGPALLLSVAGFGLCTIGFGLSTSLPLSLLLLAALGALDNISVVIRNVLVQLRTPDRLRGRVSAVNSVFIESSNEIGAFESGLVARLFGPVISVVGGGIGTLVVVAAIALWLPELRRLGEVKPLDT